MSEATPNTERRSKVIKFRGTEYTAVALTIRGYRRMAALQKQLAEAQGMEAGLDAWIALASLVSQIPPEQMEDAGLEELAAVLEDCRDLNDIADMMRGKRTAPAAPTSPTPGPSTGGSQGSV